MKRSIKSAIALCALAISFSALAEDKTFIGNINQGNWEVGGNLSAYHNSGANQGSYNFFSVSPTLQYFLMDRLSVGGFVTYTHYAFLNSTVENDWSIGPVATYHFLTAGPSMDFYVRGGADYTHTSYSYGPFVDSDGTVLFSGVSSSTSHWETKLSVGANYFFTPSVALGPGFLWTHAFSSNSFGSGDQEQFFIQFSIFL